jgi:hypothetical protein
MLSTDEITPHLSHNYGTEVAASTDGACPSVVASGAMSNVSFCLLISVRWPSVGVASALGESTSVGDTDGSGGRSRQVGVSGFLGSCLETIVVDEFEVGQAAVVGLSTGFGGGWIRGSSISADLRCSAPLPRESCSMGGSAAPGDPASSIVGFGLGIIRRTQMKTRTNTNTIKTVNPIINATILGGVHILGGCGPRVMVGVEGGFIEVAGRLEGAEGVDEIMPVGDGGVPPASMSLIAT